MKKTTKATAYYNKQSEPCEHSITWTSQAVGDGTDVEWVDGTYGTDFPEGWIVVMPDGGNYDYTNYGYALEPSSNQYDLFNDPWESPFVMYPEGVDYFAEPLTGDIINMMIPLGWQDNGDQAFFNIDSIKSTDLTVNLSDDFMSHNTNHPTGKVGSLYRYADISGYITVSGNGVDTYGNPLGELLIRVESRPGYEVASEYVWNTEAGNSYFSSDVNISTSSDGRNLYLNASGYLIRGLDLTAVYKYDWVSFDEGADESNKPNYTPESAGLVETIFPAHPEGHNFRYILDNISVEDPQGESFIPDGLFESEIPCESTSPSVHTVVKTIEYTVDDEEEPIKFEWIEIKGVRFDESNNWTNTISGAETVKISRGDITGHLSKGDTQFNGNNNNYDLIFGNSGNVDSKTFTSSENTTMTLKFHNTVVDYETLTTTIKLNVKINSNNMSELKKFIDKNYLVEFWKRIKTIPENSKYDAVTGQDASKKDVTAAKTLIGHIEELYKKINAADDAAIKSVTEGTDSTYLTVNTNNNKEVTITLNSEGFAEDLTNDILSAINEASDGGITITPAKTDGKVTGITIGIDSDTMGTINSALQTVETTGYLTGTGVSGDAINIDSNKIATVDDDTEGNDKLVTVGYLESEITNLDTSAVTVGGGKYSVDGITATDVAFTKDGSSENYYVNLTSNDGTVFDIKLDASNFVKDSFLQSVEIGDYENESGKKDALIFTWVIDNIDGASAPAQKETRIKIADFITPYTNGAGISLGNNGHTITALAKTSDYVTVKSDGIQLDSNKIAVSNDYASDTKLATDGYVKEAVDNAIDSVTIYEAGGGIVFSEPDDNDADERISVIVDDSTISIDSDSNSLYVKIDSSNYLETTEDGIGINSDKITSTYDSAATAETTNIALVGYVDGAIEAAVGDVTTYEAGSFIEFSDGTDADKAIKVKVGNGIDNSAEGITVLAANSTINVSSDGISVNVGGYLTTDESDGVVLNSEKLADSSDAGNSADSTNIALVGYVDKAIENAIDGVTVYAEGAGINFTDSDSTTVISLNVKSSGTGLTADTSDGLSVNVSDYVTIDSGNNIVLNSERITNGSDNSASTNLATVGYVNEAIAAIPVHEVEYWGGASDADSATIENYATTNFSY